jgi:hypothetical protein
VLCQRFIHTRKLDHHGLFDCSDDRLSDAERLSLCCPIELHIAASFAAHALTDAYPMRKLGLAPTAAAADDGAARQR